MSDVVAADEIPAQSLAPTEPAAPNAGPATLSDIARWLMLGGLFMGQGAWFSALGYVAYRLAS